MKSLRKWGWIVGIIITVAMLAIVLLAATPLVKRYQSNLNATKLLAVVSTNNPIPSNMKWFAIWGQDVTYWVVWNIEISWSNSIVHYESWYAPDLDHAAQTWLPIMIVNDWTDNIFVKDSNWDATWKLAADFQVWNSDWSSLRNIKNLFSFNRTNGNILTIKRIDIAWTKKMTDTEAWSSIVRIWTASFIPVDDSSNAEYDYQYNYSLK